MSDKNKKNKNNFFLKEQMALIKHPWFIIIAVLIITGIFTFFMVTNTSIDNDMTRFLPENNKERVRYVNYEYLFGSGSGVAISLKGSKAFSKEIVRAVYEITKNVDKINNRILKDLLYKDVKLSEKNKQILFNFLLTEMGRQDFSLKNLKKSLTDKKVLASKLGVNLSSGGGSSSGSADPFDTMEGEGGNSQSSSSDNSDPYDTMEDNQTPSTSSPSSTNTDPYDTEEQENLAITEKNVTAIVNYFKNKTGLIKKVYNIFSISIDRKNKIKSKWIDDILSFTDTDYAIIEFVNKQKFYKIFKGVPKLDVDLLLSYLLEYYVNTKEKIKNLFSNSKKLSRKTGLSIESAKIISKSLKNFPFENFLKEFNNQENLQLKTEKLIRIKNLQDINSRNITLLRNRVKNWNFFNGSLVSYDGKSTIILVKYVPNIKAKENSRAFKYIDAIVKKALKGKNIKVHIAGEPVVIELLGRKMSEDIAKLFPFVVLVVILFLYFSFKHIKGVFLPLVTVVFSVIWAIGAMALFGIALNVISTTLPTLLVAVGSAYGIHIISDFYLNIEKGIDKYEAIDKTIKRVGLAVVLAGLTTIAGFSSNLFNDVVPIKEFGGFTALGVFFALIISMFFIPALLRLGKIPKKFQKEDRVKIHESSSHKFLEAIGRSTYNKRWLYVILFVVILTAAIIGTTLIKVDMDNLKFFKYDTKIRKSDRFLNKNFGGTTTMTIVFNVKESIIKQKLNEYKKARKSYNSALNSYNQNKGNTEKKNALEKAKERLKKAELEYNSYKSGMIRPEFLRTLNDLQEFLSKKNYPGGNYIGKTLSIVDFLKKFNQTYNFGNPKYYKIPNKIQISNFYITSFHSDSLEDYIINSYKTSRMVVQIKDSSNITAQKIMNSAKKFLDSRIDKTAYNVVFTGIAKVKVEVNNLIINGQLSSIIFSLIAVFLIILIAYRTFVGGIISIIPLSMTILFNFGFMGFLGISLDAGTALVASIAIGIGVDYTIHYINTFRAEAKESGESILDVIIHTTSHSGRAILINALAVAAGFLVLAFSSFNSIMYMGILVALTMLVSSFSSITFIPAFLGIIKPKSLLKQKNVNKNQEVSNES